jgi:hypothetical protein
VRLWQRQGRLRGHQCFSWSWKCGGEPSGNINVRTEQDAIVLVYRARSYGETEWVALHGKGDFFGEGCLTGQPRRLATVVAMADCDITRIDKATMVSALRFIWCPQCRFIAERNPRMN